MLIRRPWLLVAAAWVIPATLAALQGFAQHRLGNWEGDLGKIVLFEFVDWLLYGAITPIVFAMGNRFPLARPFRASRLMLHAAAALGTTALWAAGGTVLRALIYPEWDALTLDSYVGWLFSSLPFGFAVYFAVLGIQHAIRYFAEAREREMAATRLSAQLAEARLGALRMQLNPHFLFNTLNATLVLVRDRDTATATGMLERLSEMLRQVLRTDRPKEVPLRDELAFLERYLGIEQVRFSDRLQVVFQIAEETRDALVPDFLLQPLVENAIRHGLAGRTGAGTITIRAYREGDTLVLEVGDDGPATPDTAGSPGIGLSNTRERLEVMYQGRATLEVLRENGGTVARIRLPWMGGRAGRQ